MEILVYFDRGLMNSKRHTLPRYYNRQQVINFLNNYYGETEWYFVSNEDYYADTFYIY